MCSAFKIDSLGVLVRFSIMRLLKTLSVLLLRLVPQKSKEVTLIFATGIAYIWDSATCETYLILRVDTLT